MRGRKQEKRADERSRVEKKRADEREKTGEESR